MPVVEVSLWDIERLVGRSLSASELEDLLPRLKCEVEEISDSRVAYEATHDRPDLYSAELLSVYLKGLLGVEEGLPRFNYGGLAGEARIEGPEYRPYAFFAVVKGVRLDDEAIRQLMQLQEKVHLTYGRDRRKVSIGLYDLNGVEFPIRYVGVRPDSVKFRPLGFTVEMTPLQVLSEHPKGMAYRHLLEGQSVFPLILDAAGKVVSFPPITNSEDFKVTESTRDILVDVTSTDPEAGRRVIALVTSAVAVRGGTIYHVRNVFADRSELSPRLDPETILYDVSLNKRLLGIDLGVPETKSLLARMRMDATEKSGSELLVAYPYFRVDILHPVDIAEEVAMAYGYDRIEPQYMPPLHPGREDGLEVFSRAVREAMVGMGFLEVNSYIMTSRELMFTKMGLEAGELVEVENPRHEMYHALRVWIVPQLLSTLSNSKHAGYPQRIFEVGDVVIPDLSRENRARDERHLAFAIAGRGVTLTDGLAVLKALCSLFNVRYELGHLEHKSFIAGRTARVDTDCGELGILGEIHPQVLVNFDLAVPVVAGELNLEVLKRCYERWREGSS
ncbi:phenylalanine--tRNA ligase subunit beta [Infirmifilum lucidum]|uniref:Phenylalanine--tRNA ligase beta subunit n=1 Tax=Infirmifilum lucidum TaxID=2776706 RepID=A0A7L9FHX5_9CREN|nr:phenylalanine--tRNA ligase subunit beta [Infirmifilum lucidum]QOJ79400.1 phenylalanine--tRNA ligase subunit beta [Infirmifilum lucidum]